MLYGTHVSKIKVSVQSHSRKIPKKSPSRWAKDIKQYCGGDTNLMGCIASIVLWDAYGDRVSTYRQVLECPLWSLCKFYKSSHRIRSREIRSVLLAVGYSPDYAIIRSRETDAEKALHIRGESRRIAQIRFLGLRKAPKPIPASRTSPFAFSESA